MPEDDFAKGLVNRRQALEEKKAKSPMPDPRSPFDDGLPEGDEEIEETEAVPPSSLGSEPVTAAATPQAIAQRPKRRGPGKKKRDPLPPPASAIEPMGETAQAGAPREAVEAAPFIEGGINPKDPLIYWPKIIEAAREKGFGPEYIQIRIDRSALGVNPTEFTTADTIEDASIVAGSEETNAGQALVNYVINVIHLARKAEAKYRLYAFYKIRTTGSFPVMHMRLAHPDEIRAQEARKADYLHHQRMSGPVGPSGYSSSPVQRMTGPMGFGAAPQPPPAAPVVVQASAAPQTPTEQLAHLIQFEELRQRLMAMGQPVPPPLPQIIHAPPPPPVYQPPPPPALTKEQEELIFEAKMNRFIEAKGFVKPGLGAPPATAAAAAAANPVAAVKELIKTFGEIRGMETSVKAMFGIAEDAGEEPEDKPTKLEELSVLKIPGVGVGGRPIMLPRNTKGTLDFFQQAVMSNLETSQELGVKAIAGVAAALDKTSFGKLLESLAAKGGAPAQLAQTVKAQGLVGVGAANGTPQRVRGPLA